MPDGTIISIGVAVVLFIAATPLIRKQRKKASVELEESTLAVAQREIEIERNARLAQEDRCREMMSEQERRHAAELTAHKESNARQIGELSGRVAVLTEQFADSLADTVATKVLLHLDLKRNGNG